MVGVGVGIHYWGVGRGEGGGEQAGYCQEEEEEEHDGSGRVTLSSQGDLQVYIATGAGQDRMRCQRSCFRNLQDDLPSMSTGDGRN